MSEGSTGTIEDFEPATPLKTTTVPVVIVSEVKARDGAGETGVTPAIELQEGSDNDDAQDESMTSGESQSTVKNKPENKSGNRSTVLIIEDTMELAEVIQATLERMNMVVAHETHGTKAISKFKEMNPDVILLDISLPDMTGWKIMDAIKERAEQSGKMPIIIVITAYDDPANRLVGKLQGIFSYLIKPFTSDEIERAVTQAISSSTS